MIVIVGVCGKEWGCSFCDYLLSSNNISHHSLALAVGSYPLLIEYLSFNAYLILHNQCAVLYKHQCLDTSELPKPFLATGTNPFEVRILSHYLYN